MHIFPALYRLRILVGRRVKERRPRGSSAKKHVKRHGGLLVAEIVWWAAAAYGGGVAEGREAWRAQTGIFSIMLRPGALTSAHSIAWRAWRARRN